MLVAWTSSSLLGVSCSSLSSEPGFMFLISWALNGTTSRWLSEGLVPRADALGCPCRISAQGWRLQLCRGGAEAAGVPRLQTFPYSLQLSLQKKGKATGQHIH